MGKPRDQFGFLKGSKKSQAAQLYVGFGGIGTNDLRYEFGSSFINLLYEVSAQGHYIKTRSRKNHSTGKRNVAYQIIVNPDVPYGGQKLNFNTLTIDQLRGMMFKEKVINDLLTIWMIPSFCHKAIVDGVDVWDINGNKFTMGRRYRYQLDKGGLYPDPNGFPFEIYRAQAQGNYYDYLSYGLYPKPK